MEEKESLARIRYDLAKLIESDEPTLSGYMDIEFVEQQLQAYKDTMDKLKIGFQKLRQRCFEKGSNEWNECLSYNDDIAPLQQILNERNDNNE